MLVACMFHLLQTYPSPCFSPLDKVLSILRIFFLVQERMERERQEKEKELWSSGAAIFDFPPQKMSNTWKLLFFLGQDQC